MNVKDQQKALNWDKWPPLLNTWPMPLKALITMTIVMMSLGLFFAVGQIAVHDIIPTFSGADKHMMSDNGIEKKGPSDTRGDLFADGTGDLLAGPSMQEKTVPFYQTDEFVFALKFTHIHIFGMSAIFILMGVIVFFLNLGIKSRILLIVLPFIGIIIDLASVWLKLFVHPAFFWLHIPGGILFGMVFVIDAVLTLRQMWTNTSVEHT